MLLQFFAASSILESRAAVITIVVTAEALPEVVPDMHDNFPGGVLTGLQTGTGKGAHYWEAEVVGILRILSQGS